MFEVVFLTCCSNLSTRNPFLRRDSVMQRGQGSRFSRVPVSPLASVVVSYYCSTFSALSIITCARADAIVFAYSLFKTLFSRSAAVFLDGMNNRRLSPSFTGPRLPPTSPSRANASTTRRQDGGNATPPPLLHSLFEGGSMQTLDDVTSLSRAPDSRRPAAPPRVFFEVASDSQGKPRASIKTRVVSLGTPRYRTQ